MRNVAQQGLTELSMPSQFLLLAPPTLILLFGLGYFQYPCPNTLRSMKSQVLYAIISSVPDTSSGTLRFLL